MICRNIKILLRVAAALLIAVSLSCARSATDEPVVEKKHAVLAIRINADDVDSFRGHGSRAGEEYKNPSGNGEKMQTLRIIIFTKDSETGNWITEHNRFIDLASTPETLHKFEQFPVLPNSVKKILLIANERNVKVRTTVDAAAMSAEDYFSRFSSSAGSIHSDKELEDLKGSLLMLLDDNKGDSGILTTPLAMSAVHDNIEIGNPSPDPYEMTLTIHRAAVKYTFRITNSDKEYAHTINSIHIDNVASRQFFFPNADFIANGGFTAEDQYFWSSYITPSGDFGKTAELSVNKSIGPGETAEFGPYYLPEGRSLTGDDVYRVAFSYDGNHTDWQDVIWAIPEETGDKDKYTIMQDLPRNTHVVVNVNFNFNDFELKYTRCPWSAYNINIPDFN